MEIGPLSPAAQIHSNPVVTPTPQATATQASTSTLSSSDRKGGGGFLFTCLNVVTWPLKQVLWLFQKVIGWMLCSCCYAKDVKGALEQLDKIQALLKQQSGPTTLDGEEDYTLLLNRLPKWVFSEIIQEELKFMAKEAGQEEEQAFKQWLEVNQASKTPFIEKMVRGYMDHFDQLPALFTRLKARLESMIQSDA